MYFERYPCSLCCLEHSFTKNNVLISKLIIFQVKVDLHATNVQPARDPIL